MNDNEKETDRQFNLIPPEKIDKDITDLDTAFERIKMLEEKPIEIVYSEKINTENIDVGMLLPDSTTRSKLWYIDDESIIQMKVYENEKGKSAIWNNKITGKFLEFKYYQDNPEK